MLPKEGNGIGSFEAIIKAINKKWAILAVVAIANSGGARFNELKRALSGISSKTLIETLRQLERLGIIASDRENEFSPIVEYHLTEEGRTFQNAIIPLLKWLAQRCEISEHSFVDETLERQGSL